MSSKFSSSSPEALTEPDANTPQDPRLGSLVGGRWKLVRVLGRGGMGVVYEGQNVAIGKRIAIKFIDAEFAKSTEVIARFQREAEAASAVESAHIVEVFDTGLTESGEPYLVMELLRGESLGTRLRRLGKLPPSHAVHMVAQTLRGLERAHRAGVIHRDLKPDNLFLVDRDDDSLFVKILDFGISKIKRSDVVGPGTLTRRGTVLGTPHYMSPEQAQSQDDLDERTDLFSVGAILFECLAGCTPHATFMSYEAIIVALCTRDARDVRELEPSVPEGLAKVVHKALMRDCTLRFQTAAEFVQALQKAIPDAFEKRYGSSSASSAGPTSPEKSQNSTAGFTLPEKTQLVSVPTLPHTRVSWSTKRGALPFAHGANTDDPPARRAPFSSGRIVWMGGAATLTAFLVTLGWLRVRSGSYESHAAREAVSPEVTMRITTNAPGARVYDNDALVTDDLLRGSALSHHTVRIAAQGYEPVEQQLVLDGRTEAHIEMNPVMGLRGSASSELSSGGVSSANKPVHTSPKTGGVKAVPTTGGLQLKIEPQLIKCRNPG